MTVTGDPKHRGNQWTVSGSGERGSQWVLQLNMQTAGMELEALQSTTAPLQTQTPRHWAAMTPPTAEWQHLLLRRLPPHTLGRTLSQIRQPRAAITQEPHAHPPPRQTPSQHRFTWDGHMLHTFPDNNIKSPLHHFYAMYKIAKIALYENCS